MDLHAQEVSFVSVNMGVEEEMAAAMRARWREQPRKKAHLSFSSEEAQKPGGGTPGALGNHLPPSEPWVTD